MIAETFEFLVKTRYGFVANGNMIPCRRDQIGDELIKKEKEFASEIYIQRIKEKYL